MVAAWRTNHTVLGLADSETITTANSAAPDAWESVITANGGTAVYDTGDGAVELAVSSTTHAAQLWITPNDAAGGALELELAGRAWPTGAAVRLVEVRANSDTAYACRVNLSTSGTLVVYDAAGATKWTSTSTAPTTGTWRLYVGVAKGTGTTDGEIDVRMYTDGAKDTTANDSYTPGATVNAGTTNINGFWVGTNYAGSTTASTHAVLAAQVEASIGVIGPLTEVLPAPATATTTLPVPTVYTTSVVSGGGPMASTTQMLAPSIVGLQLTITSTLAGGATQPQSVIVNVTYLTPGDTYTVTASAAGWSRTVQGGTGTATSTQLVLTDVQTPLNTPLTYTVVTDSGSATTASTVTVTYAAGESVLTSLDGSVVAGVTLLDRGDEKSQRPRVALFPVSGRSRPIAHYDVAVDESGLLPVLTSGTATDSLRSLVAAGAPMLLRTDVGIRDLDPVEVLVVTGATRRLRGVSDTRGWDLSYQLVDDPATEPMIAATFAHFNTVYAATTFDAFNTAWAGQTFADFNAYDWVGEAS